MSTGMSSLAVVKQVVRGQHFLEGAGVRICRSVNQAVRVDPFLMLDELKLPVGQATKGFPDHPHRGMCTCTIMLKGSMEHRDSLGNRGVVSGGGCQWMVAGRGVIHSEMPVAADPTSELHGFQLWVNLPAANKMDKPAYQDIEPAEVPVVDVDTGRGHVRVLAGSWNGTTGPINVHSSQEILLLDVTLRSQGRFTTKLEDGFNCFCYVYEGAGTVGDKTAEPQHAYIMERSNGLTDLSIEAGDGGIKCLVVGGNPIGEPVASWGPFVMNTQAEIQQALNDLRSGMFARPEIEYD